MVRDGGVCKEARWIAGILLGFMRDLCCTLVTSFTSLTLSDELHRPLISYLAHLGFHASKTNATARLLHPSTQQDINLDWRGVARAAYCRLMGSFDPSPIHLPCSRRCLDIMAFYPGLKESLRGMLHNTARLDCIQPLTQTYPSFFLGLLLNRNACVERLRTKRYYSTHCPSCHSH